MNNDSVSTNPEGDDGVVQRRSVYRRHLVFYLRIFRQEDNTIFGHVVDLSPMGVMVLTEKQVVVDKVYQLRMSIPALNGVSGEREDLLFNASCRWCREDGNPEFFLSGLQINSLAERERARLEELVRDYGFGEPL